MPSSDVKITGVYTLVKDATDTDTVVAADFDTTTSLSYTSAEDNSEKIYKVYTNDVAEYGKKVYMLVTTKQDGYAVGEWISDACVITISDITPATITASSYDNTLTNATSSTYTEVLNDIFVGIKDTITVASDSIDNYTYTVYMAKSTVTSDIEAKTLTFSTTADWDFVTEVTMKNNTSYASDPETKEYNADLADLASLKNVEDGVYGFKLVKTCKKTNKSVISIDYVTINTSTKIKFTPVLSADWTTPSDTEAKHNIHVEFVKNDTDNDPVYDTEHSPSSNPISYVSESAETGVTYTLYRAELVTGQVDVVYERVSTLAATPTKSSNKTVYVWDSTTSTMKESSTSYTYTDSLTYAYEDTAKDTGRSYSYIVVASKEGCAEVFSNEKTVTGKN